MRKKHLLLCLPAILLAALLAALLLRQEGELPPAEITTVCLARSTAALFPDHRYTFSAVLQSREEQADLLNGLPLDTEDRAALAAVLADCDYETATAVLAFFREGASYHAEWYRLAEFTQWENSPDYRLILVCVPPEDYGGSDQVLTAYCSVLFLPKTDLGEGNVTVHVRWQEPASS